MPTSVTMPALGESVTEGTVTRWLKQEGDQVEVDEPLLEVSTDKVDTEIPSPAAGVLTKILVAEDETVDVGAQLAVIGGGAGAPAAAQPAQAEPARAGPAPAAPQAEAPPPQPTPSRAETSSAAPGADYGSSGAMPTQSPTSQPAPAQAVAPSAPASAPSPAAGQGAYVTPLVRRVAPEQGGAV